VLDDQSVLPPGTDVVVETYRSTQQVWTAEYSFDNSLGGVYILSRYSPESLAV
jgi:hypothetical protein